MEELDRYIGSVVGMPLSTAYVSAVVSNSKYRYQGVGYHRPLSNDLNQYLSLVAVLIMMSTISNRHRVRRYDRIG